ncbi:hypothetical protein [Virgibacillus siamensis]|uniref:hypothetical protein n=1 Tax=Virgibacillus siamensis TaxID=480071 RepID=UPI00111567AD|nr:hypothetical protein [Virgibacillus siamensis]
MDESRGRPDYNTTDHNHRFDTQDIADTNMNGQGINASETQSKRDEEFAAEMTADDVTNEVDHDEGDINSVYGWIGVALSVISFFVMPIILGAAGIILGFISRSKDADTLGNIAIIAGAASIVITLFVLPFV